MIQSVYDRAELAEMIPKGLVGAELGVWLGHHAMHLWQIARPHRLHLVDPWEPYPGVEPMWGDYVQVVRSRFQTEVDAGSVVLHKARGADWLMDQPVDSLDWVHLDGSHTYDDTTAELNAARLTVKVGGIICGHDMTVDPCSPWRDGVLRAVLEAIQDGWLRLQAIDQQRFTGWLGVRVS